MRKPTSVSTLDALGRVRLSKHFFMRDMLHSEIAQFHGLMNVPDDPDLAIEVGTRLCEDLLEPIQERWGRITIRSAYRSREVNALGNRMQMEGKAGYNCARNEANAAGHIWDMLDADRCKPVLSVSKGARPPASSSPTSPTRIRRKAAGRCWQNGSMPSCLIRRSTSFRSYGR